MSTHQNAINLSPKGEFLRTHRVGPLALSDSLSLILSVNFHPHTNRAGYFVGGGCGGWWCGGVVVLGGFLGQKVIFGTLLKLFKSCSLSVGTLFWI